ncbi:hypothetical protein GCM10007858_69260 [Bradyrhizobium liaoningense]|uniref:hypothetical protein n=1 Tax=Bradyrhizobium liaoningense TaxID=43992 RepID=UPI00235BB2FC|nr:hypothetical protein GCM10007858_69260 [Bradyrhizobium liaoningense]
MPTVKQMDKLAAATAVDKNAPAEPPTGPADAMPREYWDALLKDAGADVRPTDRSIQSRKLSEIGRHVLRVTCSRCSRIVEIKKADAARLYGLDAVWKDVGQKLLNNTCQARTGRYEEDGCWPQFD